MYVITNDLEGQVLKIDDYDEENYEEFDEDEDYEESEEDEDLEEDYDDFEDEE